MQDGTDDDGSTLVARTATAKRPKTKTKAKAKRPKTKRYKSEPLKPGQVGSKEPTGQKRGRPSGLTKRAKTRYLKAIRMGCPRKEAAQHAGFTTATLHNWLARGKLDLGNGVDTTFADFYSAVEKAKGEGTYGLVEAVDYTAKGLKCKTCKGSGKSKTTPELEFDEDGSPKPLVSPRCPDCLDTPGYWSKPNGRTALAVLERRHPETWGLKRNLDVNLQGTVQATVEVTGEVTHTHIHLSKLPVQDLIQLAWRSLQAAQGAPALQAGRRAEVIDAAPQRPPAALTQREELEAETTRTGELVHREPV